jgi:hypothetical protein
LQVLTEQGESAPRHRGDAFGQVGMCFRQQGEKDAAKGVWRESLEGEGPADKAEGLVLLRQEPKVTHAHPPDGQADTVRRCTRETLLPGHTAMSITEWYSFMRAAEPA